MSTKIPSNLQRLIESSPFDFVQAVKGNLIIRVIGFDERLDEVKIFLGQDRRNKMRTDRCRSRGELATQTAELMRLIFFCAQKRNPRIEPVWGEPQINIVMREISSFRDYFVINKRGDVFSRPNPP
jgi:hypothetical protein